VSDINCWLFFSLIYNNASKLATFLAFYFYFNNTKSDYIFFIEFFNKLAILLEENLAEKQNEKQYTSEIL